MSSFKKNTLAAALVLGMGLAGSAAAYNYYTDGDTTPEKVANFAFTGSAAQVYTMVQPIEVVVEDADLILGRTTGFTVRIGLNNSQFAEDLSLRPAGTLNGVDLPAGWTVTVTAGGTVGSNFVVFNVTPPETAGTGIAPGTIISLTTAQLRSVEELATVGGKITAFGFFADAVTTTELPNSRKNFTLLESGNPLTRACGPEDGDVNKTIDVADTSENGGHAPKTAFSPDGSIGGAAGEGFDALTFNFGSYEVGVDPAFTFDYLATDSFVSTMTGPNSFEPFTAIYMTDGTCLSGAILANGDIDGNTVTFEYTLADVNGDMDGFTVSICGEVPAGGDVIPDNNPISLSTVATRGDTDVSLAACNVLPLRYNGSVVRVYNINEAGTSSAQSFLRVINWSDSPGKVTIVGWDDAGNFKGPISYNLGAKQSKQINSEDIEKGNAGKGLTGSFGDGTGKWRLEVTGEFPGMRVMSLNRNLNDSTVTNLTDADGQGEQTLNGIFDNGSPLLP